jgi:thiosulfate dehydrogenase [quinone] large subunit
MITVDCTESHDGTERRLTVSEVRREVRRSPGTYQYIEDSPFSKALFGGVGWSWIWLIIRLYVGWEWLQAGWEKVNSPDWTGATAGSALAGFVNGALAKATGDHPSVQGWYAWFLQHAVAPNTSLWAHAVAWGETLVGIALILGIFTGISAFFGCLMNANYLLAGTVSTNPILFILAVLLVVAWRTAGWWGLDRWVLPALGTPWRPGYVIRGITEPGEPRLPERPTEA